RFSEMIEVDPRPKMSVVSYVEAGVVADAAKNPTISRQFDELIRIAGIEVRPVTVEQGRLAREAYRDFGRGSGHPAKLNFGDCFAYALAKETGESLLFQRERFLRHGRAAGRLKSWAPGAFAGTPRDRISRQ